MMNCAVAIFDNKMDAAFNVRDVLRCRAENEFHVIVSHVIGEWLKFGSTCRCVIVNPAAL